MTQELNGTLTNSANLVGTFGTNGGGGTNNYNDLTNKPQINGVELQGNKITSNLNISYNDITNKPTINGVMLQGNKTTSNLNISYNDLKNKPTLSTVATSGSYNDLSNKPTIPTKTSDLTNDSNFVTSSELATVATTGSYNDLTNTPTIPAAQVNSDWNSSSGVSEILNKPSLAAVATSGSYNDLTDTPTIPVNSDFALSGLSDTDINTPTANQVLAYDNNGKVVNSDLSSALSVTASSGVTVSKLSGRKVDKLVAFTAQFKVTNAITQNTWVDLGTITDVPNDDILTPCVWATGAFIGMVQVQTTGTIRLYPIQSTTGGQSFSFTICYST